MIGSCEYPIGFKIRRETHGTHLKCLSVHIATACYGTDVIIERTVYTDDGLGGPGEINIDVGADQVLLVVDVAIEIISLVYFQNAVVFRIGASDVITCYGTTAGNIQVGPLVHRYILCEHVDPIRGPIHQLIPVGIHRGVNLAI